MIWPPSSVTEKYGSYLCERRHTKLWYENLIRDHLKDLDTDSRIILKWIHLDQIKDERWTLVNTVTYLRFSRALLYGVSYKIILHGPHKHLCYFRRVI